MEQGGIYWNAWKDLFEFHRSHAGEKSWDMIRDDAIGLEKKYQETKASDFVNGILIQILLEMERAGT